jgi:hypothetical protein
MPGVGPAVWIGTLVGALAAGLGRVVAAIPDLLGAILILLIGWGVGKLIQTLVTRGLDAAHFNKLTAREGINDALKRAEVPKSPAQILGIVAYWFVFLMALQAAVDVLGIATLSQLMGAFVLYLPRIFAALLVVLAGAWGASFLSRLTRASATTAGIAYAGILGTVVQGFVLFFAFAIALDVLGLSFPFLTTAFAILLGALALAGALAFGLGGREYAADMMAGREVRAMLHVGDRVMADGLDGTVAAINPTFTVVKTAQGAVAVQNHDLMQRHLTTPTPRAGGEAMPKAA